MNCVVVYASRSGNTERIAAAIAEAFRSHGPVQLFAADAAPTTVPAGTDLLVVGGPTEGHGMTDPIQRFVDELTHASMEGVAVAAFDTRLRWPKVLSGSAADGIAKRLAAAGARVIGVESFIVTRTPTLEPGEEERATTWAATLVDAVNPSAAPQPVSAGR